MDLYIGFPICGAFYISRRFVALSNLQGIGQLILNVFVCDIRVRDVFGRGEHGEGFISPRVWYKVADDMEHFQHAYSGQP